jgi:glutamate synthase domain-containing protein 2
MKTPEPFSRFSTITWWRLGTVAAGLISAHQGFALGGTSLAVFSGLVGALVTMAAHDLIYKRHAVLSGTLLAGIVTGHFLGLNEALVAAMLAFMIQLAIYESIRTSDIRLAIGVPAMVGAGAFVFTHAQGDESGRAMVAALTAIGTIIAWVAVCDYYLQSDHTVLRNFPVVAWFRYGFEQIGDQLRDWLFAGDREQWPFSRKKRRALVRAGKGIGNNAGYGTADNYREIGKVHLLPTWFPIPDDEMGTMLPRIVIGPDRPQPFAPVWPMAYGHTSRGAVSEEAVRAVSTGAKNADVYMGTGEGGLWPEHKEGVKEPPTVKQWLEYYRSSTAHLLLGTTALTRPQPKILGGTKISLELGPNKFGFRRFIMDPFTGPEGRGYRKIWSNELDVEKLIEVLADDQIVMLVIKWGQGGKPAEGGKLPKEKIDQTVSDVRGIPMGEDCYSFNTWPNIRNVEQLAEFIHWFKVKVTGKPVGMKTYMGREHEVDALAKYMAQTGHGPDFLILDGGEGGTGSGSAVLLDSMGLPLMHSIATVDNAFRRHGIRDKIVLIGAGLITSADEIATGIALGLDLVEQVRSVFIGGLSCIQAMICHTDRCPTGITTNDPRRRRGLDPVKKHPRVTNFFKSEARDLITVLKPLGARHPWELNRHHVSVVTAPFVSTCLADLFPYPDDGSRNPTLLPPLEAKPGSHDWRGPKLTRLTETPTVFH